jgi:hypothetical protein
VIFKRLITSVDERAFNHQSVRGLFSSPHFSSKIPNLLNFFCFFVVPIYSFFLSLFIFIPGNLAQSILFLTYIQRCPSRFLTSKWTTLVRIFHGFSQYILTNVEMVNENIPQVLLFTSLTAQPYLITLQSCAANLPVLQNDSVTNSNKE